MAGDGEEGQGEIRLGDGRVVTLRVAAAADEPGIAELYAGLSPDSFRRRFHSGRPKPPLIARLAPEARYVPTAEDTAELALAVLDDYQGLGLGRRMLSALIDRANAAGLDRLSAVVQVGNDTMLHLLTRYGSALTEPADENFVVCLEISATGGMPGWPPRAATGQRSAAAGQRILLERRGWFEDRRVAALRAAGHEVRQCTGPDPWTARTCPLVEEGRCRLAEDADRIVTMLPGDDEDCLAVTEAHRRLWPGKLTGLSPGSLAAEPGARLEPGACGAQI